jgi:hypothetical protein
MNKKNWMPERRNTLIHLLRELSSPDLQQRWWINHEDAPNISGVDQVVHFFFDDTDLSSNPSAEIGQALLNLSEAEALKPLIDVLDRMITRLGDTTSKRYIDDSEWSDVVTLARDAAETISDIESKSVGA